MVAVEDSIDLKEPANWPSVYDALQSDPALADIATAVAQRFGDVEASAKYLATARNDSAPLQQRRSAIRNLASRQVPDLEPLRSQPHKSGQEDKYATTEMGILWIIFVFIGSGMQLM